MPKLNRHESERYIFSDFIRLIVTIIIVSIFIVIMRNSEQHYRIVEQWFSSSDTASDTTSAPTNTIEATAEPTVTPESE